VLEMAAQDSAVLSHFKIASLVRDHKYRDAPKDGHRGANINIVVHQTMSKRDENIK